MPINAPRWRFTEIMVRGAPHAHGTYILWQNDRALEAGHASGGGDTIQSRLLRRLAAGCAATHYSWQLCRDPFACAG